MKTNFRVWWQVPKNVDAVHEERTVSFLELFYDLVFVVMIIQLTYTISDNVTFESLLSYVSLYILVWIAWVNGSVYHELHGNDDIRTRVLTFFQMFALVWMGIFLQTATSEQGYRGFAFAYGGFQAILTFLWWRTGVHDRSHRPLAYPYALVYFLTSIVFVGSTFVPWELAQRLWLAAVCIVLIVPLGVSLANRVNPDHLEATQRIRPPLVERFGLLTIIVLGEGLISVVGSASYLKDKDFQSIGVISAAVLIVFSLWWLYFDFVSRNGPRQRPLSRMAWMYLHLPLTMSIGLTAVGLLTAIQHPEELVGQGRWIVFGPLVAFLAANSLLMLTLEIAPNERSIYRKGIATSLASLTFLVGIASVSLPTLTSLILAFFLLLLPVYAGFKVWLARALGP